MKNKLYITISEEKPGGSGPGKQEDSEKEQKGSLLSEYAKHEFMHLIKSSAKNMVNFGISQIGFLNGNYLQQEQVNAAKQILDKARNVGMSAYAGFKATGGNPWGAVIGAGVAVTGDIISSLQEMHTNTINNNRTNHNIEMLRIRAGLDGLNNGGRTGTQ